MILYEKKEKENSKDYAYRVLKDNIMILNLKPGELLSEADLSEKLGISRTPIREVLMRLKNEHLIEVKPQTGTYISLIDINMVEQALFMRYTLEKEVLKEACNGLSEDIIIELEKNLFAQKLISNKSNSAIEFHKLDKEFHELLFRGTNKGDIWDCILNMSTHYNRMRLLIELKNDKKKNIEDHERYLNLIKNKSMDGIDEIITSHIKDSTQDWLAIAQENDLIKYLKSSN
ncbi:GntR family transcriptional regulator [Romboutsia sp. 1001713B170207_170306_H8]|uniref:GntR family transcriptional regulator n=1 Tax=Romboutsia sp. 1001713B170207_170306_H8 TaxID=2787112 RepID=UPI0018992B0D|nr:GntR family transcriptional regulator [Romboutsia sp. 1001713B170207_170306_H8]